MPGRWRPRGRQRPRCCLPAGFACNGFSDLCCSGTCDPTSRNCTYRGVRAARAGEVTAAPQNLVTLPTGGLAIGPQAVLQAQLIAAPAPATATSPTSITR